MYKHQHYPSKILNFFFTFFLHSDPEGDVYTLDGQARHKLTFLNSLGIPTRLILIGHSIGCYLLLKMLDHLPMEGLLHCVMLFPTVERLALSPSGYYATPLAKYFRWMVWPSVWMVSSVLPQSLILTLLRKWYFHGRNNVSGAVQATYKLVHANSASLVAQLGHLEMQEVVELDSEVVARYQDKMTWYYGVDDHWCPTNYYEDMRARFPRMDVRLCAVRCEHAFVFKIVRQ